MGDGAAGADYDRRMRTVPLSLAGWIGLAVFIGALCVGAAAGDADRMWRDRRLPSETRESVSRHLGFAPPAFTPELQWFDGESLEWSELRGKVVLVQTWTRKNASASRWPDRLERAFPSPVPDDLVILALHTPRGAHGTQEYLDRRPPPEQVRVVLDHSGRFCESLGAPDHAVNILVDRSGEVRHVGLHLRGLEAAAAALLAEPFDPDAPAPGEAPPIVRDVLDESGFPPSPPSRRWMNDLLGKPAPAPNSLRWFGERRDLEGIPHVIEFYVTWCPHCRTLEPHMNRLSRSFDGHVAFVTVNTESRDTATMLFRSNRFARAIAFDDGLALAKEYKARYPSAVLVCSEGLVRWQGNPFALTEETIARFIRADRERNGKP